MNSLTMAGKIWITCFRCGHKGHYSANCTNTPLPISSQWCIRNDTNRWTAMRRRQRERQQCQALFEFHFDQAQRLALLLKKSLSETTPIIKHAQNDSHIPNNTQNHRMASSDCEMSATEREDKSNLAFASVRHLWNPITA